MRNVNKEKVLVALAIIILIAAFLLTYIPKGPLFGKAVSTGMTHAISIQNFAFSQLEVTINVGDTVTWTNNDQATHMVVSRGSGPLDSGTMVNGQSYSYTFVASGTYEFFCSLHPFIMIPGRVIVINATPAIPPTPPSPPLDSLPPQPSPPPPPPAATPPVIEMPSLNITLVTPSHSGAVQNGTVNFTYLFQGITPSQCMLYGNFSGTWQPGLAQTVAVNGSYTFTSNLLNGSYLWNVLCSSSSTQGLVSKWGSRNYTLTVAVPASSLSVPNISQQNQIMVALLTPADRAALQNESVSFSFSFTGPTQGSCQLYGDFNGSWSMNTSLASLNNGTSRLTFNVGNGRYLWNVHCVDSANLSNEDWSDYNWSVSVSQLSVNVSSQTNATNITSCLEAWSCTGWSLCEFGRQTRICTDQNNCGTFLQRPPQTQVCVQQQAAATTTSPASGSNFPSTNTAAQPTRAPPSFPAPSLSDTEKKPLVQQPKETTQKKSTLLFLILGTTVALVGFILYRRHVEVICGKRQDERSQ
ncbi:hypothetical protein J4421_00695 [Candidatus Woesearchaeota archaeon]|nr:hypothetical protein [Candidatus Woesearchaeota archaeon]